MKKVELYNREKTYYSPSGFVWTPEAVLEKHPAMFDTDYLVVTDESGEMALAFEHVGQVRSHEGIDPTLSVQDVIKEVEIIENMPPEPAAPSAEERLASAQEYKNLMDYGDTSVSVLALNAGRGLWSESMTTGAIAQISDVLSDEDAMAIQPLCKEWADIVEKGGVLKANEPFTHNGILYRAVSDITPQAHQEPGATGMLAVYRPLDKKHAGTKKDPIPYRVGMEALEGKFYLDGDVLYKCTRAYDGGTGHTPAQLVGLYFSLVEG